MYVRRDPRWLGDEDGRPEGCRCRCRRYRCRTDRRSGQDSPCAPFRLRQGGPHRSRKGACRQRRGDALDGRHREGDPHGGTPRQGRLRVHRLAGDHGRPREDAAPAGARRHPDARHRRRHGAADADRRQADRPRGGQPLPLLGDRREGRALGRLHREYRHWRADDGARGRKEPRARLGRGRRVRLRHDRQVAAGGPDGGSAQAARSKGLLAHGDVRHYDCRVAPGSAW